MDLAQDSDIPGHGSQTIARGAGVGRRLAGFFGAKCNRESQSSSFVWIRTTRVTSPRAGVEHWRTLASSEVVCNESSKSLKS